MEQYLLPVNDLIQSSYCEDIYYSSEWLFKNPDNTTEAEFFKQKVIRIGINRHWAVIFKHFLVHKLGGFKGEKPYLSATKSQLRVVIDGATPFLRWASKYHPEKYLAEMDEVIINNFVRNMFDSAVSYGTLTLRMQFLRDSYRGYARKLIPDGLLFDIDYIGRLPKPNSILSALCIEYCVDFADWGQRRTHGSIPVYTAMTLLSHAVADLRSNFTKFAIEYYAFLRKNHSQFTDFRKIPNKLFCLYQIPVEKGDIDPLPALTGIGTKASENTKVIRQEYFKCKRSGEKFDHKLIHKKFNLNSTSDITRAVYTRNKENWDRHYNLYLEFIDVISKYLTVEESKNLTHNQVAQYVKNVVRPATLTVFLTLTGSRAWSEIRHLKYKDIISDSKNPKRAKYTTPINKTNHGIKEERDAYNLITEAADCLDRCKLNLSKELYLFSNNGLSLLISDENQEPDIMSAGRLTACLKEYYEKFGNSQPELFAEHPELKAHQFRHTWAEFALRMFEGNVVEDIRQHFMHSYRSYMTNQYTFDKLKQEVSDDLVKKYLKEILGKIVNQEALILLSDDSPRDLEGMAVQAIANSIKDAVLTLDQLDEFVERFVDEVSDNYIHIRAHEYGYCLTAKALVKNTGCYDTKSGMSDFDAARFSICAGCVSFCASKVNNEAAIIRQSIAHQAFAKNRIEVLKVSAGDILVKESLKAAEQGKKILSKWKHKL
jgi:integrase